MPRWHAIECTWTGVADLENRSVIELAMALGENPAVNVPQHGRAKPVVGGIQAEVDVETGRRQQLVRLAGFSNGDTAIGRAVADEDAELVLRIAPHQWERPVGEPTVQGNDSRELLREREPQMVRDTRPFAESGQENAFGVNMADPHRLLNGGEDVFLDHAVTAAVPTPTVAKLTVCPMNGTESTKADADVVAARNVRNRIDPLVFLFTVTMQEDEKRIRIPGLVSLRQKERHGHPPRFVKLTAVDAFLSQYPRVIQHHACFPSGDLSSLE